MNPTQIIAVVTGILPEVVAFIKGFFTASGTLPTDAQVIANMNIDAARVTTISNAWLAANPPSNLPSNPPPNSPTS